ncbi:PepSY-like domain-containing protein [Chitinophaga solisilvae]|uniref:PepSY-like domain-containing protein n=1 Tax=Chitinophaga solisilvae TaxID=1233460 RepID=UPI001367B2CA|nr:PepSY-like domain-containing protein [Chitinophaga solisilvae]
MKMLTLFAAVLISLHVAGQDIPAAAVPAPVITTFHARFPTAAGLEWEQKMEGYEAEFRVNRLEHKALLDSTGKLLRYKRDVPASALPAAVKNTISNQYKGFRIDDAEQVEMNGKVWYQVELDGEPHDRKVVLSKDGKVDDTLIYW